jgi:hypothetical protein
MAFVHIQISLKGAKIQNRKKKEETMGAVPPPPTERFRYIAAATWRDGTSSRFDTTNYFLAPMMK